MAERKGEIMASYPKSFHHLPRHIRYNQVSRVGIGIVLTQLRVGTANCNLGNYNTTCQLLVPAGGRRYSAPGSRQGEVVMPIPNEISSDLCSFPGV